MPQFHNCPRLPYKNNFKLFNTLAETFKIHIGKIKEFLESVEQIDKIIEMFIFILETNRSYPKEALINSYCYLSFDGNYFGNEYDDSDTEDSDDSGDDLDQNLINEKREA